MKHSKKNSVDIKDKIIGRLFVSVPIIILMFIFGYVCANAQYYTIKRGGKEILTQDSVFTDWRISQMDSLVPSPCSFEIDSAFNQSIVGRIMWFDINVRRMSEDTMKFFSTEIIKFQYGYVFRYELFNGRTNEAEQCSVSHYLGAECDLLWQDGMNVQVLNDNQISINSSQNVNVELYKAYDLLANTYINRFSIAGDGNNHVFDFTLETDEIYLVVFRNSNNEVINIKEIERD